MQKKISFGDENKDKTIYIVKPDYQDGVEGLLSLLYKQILYIDFAKRKGYVPFVDWKNYKTQYYDGKNNAWEFFFKQPSEITEAEVYKSQKVYQQRCDSYFGEYTGLLSCNKTNWVRNLFG